ncbi:PhoH family protein [Rubritalea sp.]|uniref:PhoH family protein n=1 Tax=Rubritalea sp. TaxID=2109375 RepID=UPI003EFB0CC5
MLTTMDEIEERLEFESPQFAHALFANEPRELTYLWERLGVKVVAREGWILLRGSNDGVERAKRAIIDLEEARRSGSDISAKDFRTAIDVAAEDGKTGIAQLGKMKLLATNGRKPVVPRTPQQMAYIQSMTQNDVVFGLGPAGTGKTYLAMAMGLSLLKAKKINRIVLTRPAVEAGESLGFLPGDLQEKVAPYLRPLYDAMYDMLDAETGKRYMEDGTIEIAPLAYMRGRTLANSFVILDEAQNTTPEQLFMLLTRIGEGSQCVVTGDGSQVDLKKGQMSGLVEAEHALKEVESVDFVRFTGSDVVRHPVVARIIAAYETFRE